MFTLIRSGEVYGPERKGVRDILIVGGVIAKMAERIDLPEPFHLESSRLRARS